MTLLILAGTSEARMLCDQLANKSDVIASLAGATRAPTDLAVKTRIGGFGGVVGFEKYCKSKEISGIIDATHPFASIMTETAARTAKTRSLPHMILQRPEWQPELADSWHMIDQIENAHLLIPKEATIFVGTGRQTLDAYMVLSGRQLLVRVIDPPRRDFPFENGEFVVGKPPFSIQEEIDFLQARNVDWLVVKNSGGAASFSKLAAARHLSLPVAMIKRPVLPDAMRVETVEAALNWISEMKL